MNNKHAGQAIEEGGTLVSPLIGILYAQLGWFSRRAEPEAPAGAAVAEQQA